MPSRSSPSIGTEQEWPNGAAVQDTPSRNLGQPQPYPQAAKPNWSSLSSYYQDEFRKIHESGEVYKGKWNWAAFCFGGIWALTKGVWLSVLICFVVSIVTGGIGGVVYWIIFAARGNYMYYCAQTKGKQIPV
jgi:hypothetical protein